MTVTVGVAAAVFQNSAFLELIEAGDGKSSPE